MRSVLVLAGVALLAAGGALGACSSSPAPAQPSDGGEDAEGGGEDAEGGTTCVDTLPEGGPVQVTGTVVSAADDGGTSPIANAMVAVEYGGLYLPWCNLAQASPYYRFGAVTDDAGAFTMTAAAGKLGFHGFATGQYYSRAPLDTSTGTSVTIILAPEPAGPKPTITGASFTPTTVPAGAQVTLTATVTAGSPTDPLSDETMLVEPTHSWARELNPPSLGKKDNFPDGSWSLSFAAPAEAGTYTYWLSATSAGCVTSDVGTLSLVVQ